MLRNALILAALGGLAGAPAAAAHGGSWAAPEIRAVTKVGVLGTSPGTFRPQAPLTQRALAAAIATTNHVQTPPAAPPPAPAPVSILSSLPADATVAGQVQWAISVPGQSIDHVAFAVDGQQRDVEWHAPYALAAGAGLDTTTLADGAHQLAVDVVLPGGASYVAVWQITVANAPGATLTPLPPAPVPVPIVSSPPPTPAPLPPPPPVRQLYRAQAPSQPVTIKQLDAVLVDYLNLAKAAREIQTTLRGAGLRPRPDTGTEAVARMLGLRLDHPAAQDGLELLPFQPATRAEAAWSFAHVLQLSDWQLQAVQQAADAFTLPSYGSWQRRILTTAISFVGYPYVWGGTDPGSETEFGVHSVGGFDCSGFVWRVYKLTPYAGEGALAAVLRGRTTYVMSGEVPRLKRIPIDRLQPADVMFFGNGPRSRPSQVDHTAIYLGNGWFVQSSGQGVTLLPFDGWYRRSFAWARRPLHEAGLT